MDSPSETQGMDLLFKKLGHEIAEIRTRALDSILSKLKHGLIHDTDIVQERQLMVRLLEWFNFHPAPSQDKVFQLLNRLTKHSSACDLLVSVGAVTFFSRLRTDIDSTLRSQVDVIIDRLLHVTDRDILQVSAGSRRCVYGKSKSIDDNDDQEKATNKNANHGYFKSQEVYPIDDTSSTATPPLPMICGIQTEALKCEPECLKFAGFPWHSLTGTDRHVLSSTGASLCSPSAHLVRNACAFLLDVIFRDFPPEIFLQRPSIVQTLLTLISSRPGGQLMSGALECLQALAHGLISRLHFFQDPTFYCPRQGLPFHCNGRAGNRYSTTDSFSESDAASRSEGEGALRLERSGGDGRDDRSSSSATNSMRTTPLSGNRDSFQRGFSSMTWNSSEANDELEQDITALQRSKVPTPQFCISALLATLPSMKTDSCRLTLSLLHASFPLVHLLACSVRPDRLWTDRSILAQNLQTQVRQLLEVAGDALLYHYNLDNGMSAATDNNPSQNSWVAKHWSKLDVKMHRIIYQTMANFLLKLTQAVLPIDQSSKEIKSSLGRALFVISCDEAFHASFYPEYEIALSYLEQCSPDKHEVLSRMRKIANSFIHTHMFMRDYQVIDGDAITMEIMELAESSVDALPYHSNQQHLQTVIQAIAKVFMHSNLRAKEANEVEATSRGILLKLLAHPLVGIRRTVYEETLRLVRSGVSVAAAAENLGHTASYITRFILDSDVLYEICCYGLRDTSRLVSHPAQELITLLLEGRLLVADEIWDCFCVAIQPVLPVLQAYTGETEVLQSAINLFISASEHPVEDWDIHCIRACFRGLMLKHRASRSASGVKLLKILTNDDSSVHVTGLTDLLLVDTPLSLVPRDEADCFRIRRCVFQEEAITRMLSVFRSTSTDDSVRTGALRQLATMLDDHGLHRAFLHGGGLTSICSKLKEIVQDEVTVLTDDMKPALSSCVLILKLLLRSDPVSRERLSHDKDLLVALLRAADLCRLSVASLSEVSVVIALLVFHDVLREYKRPKDDDTKTPTSTNKSDCMELSLPATILTRYQIPFLCPTHHSVSVYRTLVCPPSPSCDPLISGPPSVALRMAWNLARFDGDVISLCAVEVEKKDKDEEDDISNIIDLRLTEEDKLFLSLSHPDTLTSLLLDAILSSQSHAAVSHVFSLLMISMMSSTNSLPIATNIMRKQMEKWKEVLKKFLQVAPSCYEDEALLMGLTGLLDKILEVVELHDPDSDNETSDQFVNWLVQNCILSSTKAQQVLEGSGSALLKVLESSEPQPEPVSSSAANETHTSSVTIRRQLSKSILSLLARTSRILSGCHNDTLCACFHRQLRTVILLRLRLADAPQFYDLPSMEVTLECLVHVSATRIAQRSTHHQLSMDQADQILSQQLLHTLLEIVSAFHIGSGASSLSYMGKGVSRCATQCILYIAREMETFGIMNWPALLEYSISNQPSNQQNAVKIGFEWLVPLWSARDPRTRFSGLAIASTASLTKQGSIALSEGFLKYPGGLWNMVLGVILDHTECSSVRTQACNLLCNLISHKFDSPGSREPSWKGPCVETEDSGSTASGIPALISLLHHTHVFEHFSFILSRYHNQLTVRSPALMQSTPLGGAARISETSVASIAGSADSSEKTGKTTLTQAASPNPFSSLTSNKESLTSSHQTAGHVTDDQQTENLASHSPQVETLPDEWSALASPSLITSLCRFLCNLMVIAPHDTLRSLIETGMLHSFSSILDANRIESILDKISAPADADHNLKLHTDSAIKSRLAVLSRDLLAHHELTTRLFTVIMTQERSMAPKIVCSDEVFVRNILSALKLEALDSSWSDAISSVHQSIMDFICASIHQNIKNPLSTSLMREWHLIYDCLSGILLDDNRKHLHTSCLRTLALLFHSEAATKSMEQRHSDVNLTWLLDKNKGGSCDATDLVKLLVKIFENLIVKPSAGIPGDVMDHVTATGQALQNLFACSSSAQMAALEMGFLESCLENIKRHQLKMSLQFTTSLANKSSSLSSNDSKSSSSILFDEYAPFVQPIILLLSLLTNLLQGYTEAKKAAAGAGLSQILSQLWGWTSSFPNLHLILLKFVVTYSAHCEQASASLTLSQSGQTSVSACLVRLCRDVHRMALMRTKFSSNLLHFCFEALTNCACAQECRAVLWKTNLLELFPAAADRGQHPKRSNQQSALLEHWLKLLLALSFHTDGQWNILKIRDIFEILIELHNSNIHSSITMVIIRNLCFHLPSKHRISAHGQVVRLLMSRLNEKDDSNNVAASAILSLLCNSQKAKVHLKAAGLSQNLHNALARLSLADGSTTPTSDMHYKTTLTTMLDIMRS